MVNILHREFVYLWYYFTIQFWQIFPYWVLGMLIGSFISVFLKEKLNKLCLRFSEIFSGYFGLMVSSILGILSPLCLYGTIPLAASFSQAGVKDDWLGSFMMSSILLNPQLIIYSAALGEEMLLIRIFSCFFGGFIAGIILKHFFSDKPFFDFKGFSPSKNRDTDPNILMRYVKNVGRNIKATGGYFLLGVVLSALFQRYIPAEFVETLFGSGGFGVLMAATIGVPLYACGGGTIPLLNVWLNSGMSPGSGTAFMITGPATKITNLGALKIVLGFKHFLYYLIYVMLFALISGLLVNLIF